MRAVEVTVEDCLVPRSHYPAVAEFVYLNQASLGMMGQPAVTALQGFIEDVGRHGNLFMSDAMRFPTSSCFAVRRLQFSERPSSMWRSWAVLVSCSVNCRI
jgi:hypothetical protein